MYLLIFISLWKAPCMFTSVSRSPSGNLPGWNAQFNLKISLHFPLHIHIHLVLRLHLPLLSLCSHLISKHKFTIPFLLCSTFTPETFYQLFPFYPQIYYIHAYSEPIYEDQGYITPLSALSFHRSIQRRGFPDASSYPLWPTGNTVVVFLQPNNSQK